MSRTETITVQVDAELKAEAEAVLQRLGLSASEAVALFFDHVARKQRLPFVAHIPNAETRQAMAELDAGQGTAYPDTDALFKALGIDS